MTTEDKTGDKLVASIRKTKAGATASAQPDNAKPANPAPRKKAAAKRAVKSDTSTKSAPEGGQYQSVRRVWPD